MPTLRIVNEDGYKALRNLALNRPQIFTQPKDHDLAALMVQEAGTEDVWKPGEIEHGDLQSLNDETSGGPGTDAVHAKTLREAFPQINLVAAADGNLWASINCFGLPDYVPVRWSTSNNRERNPSQFVRDHWLQYDSGTGRESNAAARLWWMVELAERVARHSEYSAEHILDQMAGNVNFYHQTLDRPYLAANAKLLAVLYDVFLDGNEHLSNTKNANELFKNLNVRAGAMSLDLMSPEQLRAVVEEAKPPKG